ncbi:hypothetical protein CBOM_08147 [Ceraceosorus bombacis]|uniref:Uncharacterized protein n=1 Tax=Ceraceosorus bombacis TaxID=401625 RepID=A0A0P1B9Z5_9BASI|nr:hypothetical protein CBOM_08147 [Ceraceosorus bombacis]
MRCAHRVCSFGQRSCEARGGAREGVECISVHPTQPTSARAPPAVASTWLVQPLLHHLHLFHQSIFSQRRLSPPGLGPITCENIRFPRAASCSLVHLFGPLALRRDLNSAFDDEVRACHSRAAS